MNTITPLNPDVKPDALPESPVSDAPSAASETSMDPLDYTNYSMPAFEVEQSKAPTVVVAAPAISQNPAVSPQPVAMGVGPMSPSASASSMTLIASSGFLMKYIASLFAGISVLSGLSSLGFILLDHFINKPEGAKIGSMFDASTIVSTWHVWLVASVLTFVALYLVLSRASGKYLAGDNASEREVQVGEVARSIFTAVLIIFTTYLVASLLFTLLNSTLAAAEVEGKDIAIQVAGSVLAFIWVGLIIKHQSSVHLQGKNGVAGAVLAGAVLTVAVLASVFLLAAGRNAVIDSRTVSDLSTVQSELSSYKAKNDTFPESLTTLPIEDAKVKGRLAKYTYTRTQPTAQQSSFNDSYEDMLTSDSFYGSTSTFGKTATIAESGYKLCATFLTDASSKSNAYDLTTTEATGSTSANFYSHGKGEHCVERDV
jgi:hypothetical protein